MDDAPTDKPARRRIDVMSAMMAVVTVASIGGIAWLRYGPTSSSGHSPVTELAMDSEAPPLRLLDLKTSEPLVLFGLGDRVVWVVFWSAGAASGRECLEELEPVWNRLKGHRRFAMVTAAVEVGEAARVRGVMEGNGVHLPVYLATPETQRQFHVQGGDPPLHVLIDAGGRVIAMARHAGRPTIDRIAAQVRRRLEELDPIGETRFASSSRRSSAREAAHARFR
ncbi:MAG: TlpA family protein disulfide reductase [Isosphaeraceae bacterium]